MFYPKYTKTIIKFLQVFETLHKSQIIDYIDSNIEANDDEDISDGEIILNKLTKVLMILYENENGYVSLYPGASINYKGVAVFAALSSCFTSLSDMIIKRGGDNQIYSYVMLSKNKIYEIIEYENNGAYKLRFAKQTETYKDNVLTPIIVMINQPADTVIPGDCIPDNDYILAKVNMDYVSGKSLVEIVNKDGDIPNVKKK